MRKFTDNYYRPWSPAWIAQRIFLKIKEFRLQDLSLSTLLTDYRMTRRIRRDLRCINLTDIPEPDNSASGKRPAPLITCESVPEQNLSPLNSYFDHIYVVNLARREDRRSRMVGQLSKLNIRAEFFPAEDGCSPVNMREFKSYLDKPVDPVRANELEIRLKRKVIYSPGAWGTLKTYHKLLQDAKSRGFRKILSLEDDVVFARDFDSRFTRAAGMIPADWKLLYLGASQHSWKEGTDLAWPATIHEGKGISPYYLPVRTDGAFAIGIYGDLFAILMSETEKMNCSFDSGALRKAAQLFRGQCYVICPNLIIADVSDSDNFPARQLRQFAKTVRWDLSMYEL